MATVRTQTCQRHTAAAGTLCPELFLLRLYLGILDGIFLPNIKSRHIPSSSLLNHSFVITYDTNKRIGVFQVIPAQQVKLFHPDGQGGF